MRIVAGYVTHRGRVRDGNEDALLVDGQLRVFAVADGVGGHRAGEVASGTAVEAIRASLARGEAIDEAIRDANHAIFARANADASLHGMGTTVTAAIVAGEGQLLIGHVGDSRAYLVRDGALSRLTTDHSLVQELLVEGRITADQAATHPQRSIITRAVGMETNIDVDVYPVEVHDGDQLLLCSDGLTDMVSEHGVHEILSEGGAPQDRAEALVDRALENGGADNVTAIVLHVSDVGGEDSIDLAAAPSVYNAHTSDGPTDPPSEQRDAIPAHFADGTGVNDSIDHKSDGPSNGGDVIKAARDRRARLRRVVRFGLVPLGIIALFAALAIGVLRYHATHQWYIGVDKNSKSAVLYRGDPSLPFGPKREIVESVVGIPLDAFSAAIQADVANNEQCRSSSESQASTCFKTFVSDKTTSTTAAPTSTSSATSSTLPRTSSTARATAKTTRTPSS